MDKYLVTGGAGFIGSNIVEQLDASHQQIVIVDDLSMGKLDNISTYLKERVRFYNKSITDFQFMQELLKKEKFDYIILLGAIASVTDSINRPFESHQINCEANLNILETIKKYSLPLKKLLFASSAAVYGNEQELPKKENSLIDPLTPYAIDKYTSERYTLSYGKLYGIPTVATRFFNVYGPRQNPSSPYSGVLSIIYHRLKNDLQFTVFGDGSQTRDFIYVKDVVRAVLLLLHDENVFCDVYNVATGNQTTLNQDIQAFEEVMGKKLLVEYHPTRTGDIKDSYADISKLKALGFQPKYNIEEGLYRYVDAED